MRTFLLVAAVLLATSHAALAQTVTFDEENRTLSIVAKNGRKHNFESVRQKPVRSTDGAYLFYCVRTGGGFENDGDSVFAYRLADGSVKRMFKATDNVSKIQPVATKNGVQGAVVTTESGAMNSPVIYVVHAEKGKVWGTPTRGYASKIVQIQGDVLKVQVYKGDFEEGNAKLEKTAKLSLSKLLR
jgi:hypothetical protein